MGISCAFFCFLLARPEGTGDGEDMSSCDTVAAYGTKKMRNRHRGGNFLLSKPADTKGEGRGDENEGE